jgi:hypothetical protein
MGSAVVAGLVAGGVFLVGLVLWKMIVVVPSQAAYMTAKERAVITEMELCGKLKHDLDTILASQDTDWGRIATMAAELQRSMHAVASRVAKLREARQRTGLAEPTRQLREALSVWQISMHPVRGNDDKYDVWEYVAWHPSNPRASEWEAKQGSNADRSVRSSV